MSADPLNPDSEGPPPEREDGGLDATAALEAVPVLARLGASAAWRGAGWTLDAYVQGMNWLTRTALSDGSTAETLNDARAELRRQARRMLGLDEVGERITGESAPPRGERAEPAVDPLRERGLDLLQRSADVEAADEAHPAYERILTQLAPDEARILRLLAIRGARPAVDVRTWRPLDIGAQTVAPGLSMIGAEAGCRYTERVPAYLNNLFRLGLIWFARDPLDDPKLYQVLEAQPEVLEAMRKAGRAKTVRRSIHLTPFGIDFCETCLPLSAAEADSLEERRLDEQRSSGP